MKIQYSDKPASGRQALLMLYAYVARQKKLVGLAVVFNVVMAVFDGSSIGLIALAVSFIVDQSATSLQVMDSQVRTVLSVVGLEYSKHTVFLFLILTAAIAQIGRALVNYLTTVIAAVIETRVLADMKDDVIRNMMRLSYREVAKYPAGELQAHTRLIIVAATTVTLINSGIANALVLAGYVGLLLWMSWKLSLAAIVIIWAFYLITSKVMHKIRHAAKRGVEAAARLGKELTEFLHAPKLLRQYSLEDFASRKIMQSHLEAITARRDALILNGAIAPLFEVLTVVVAIGSLLIAYFYFFDESSSILSTMLAFIFVLYRTASRATAINSVRAGLAKAIPAAGIVTQLISKEGKEFTRRGGVPVGRLEHSLKFENVYFSYESSKGCAVSGLTFNVPKGSVVAFVGKSGAGKSTILDLMLGIYEPQRGSIIMDGIRQSDAAIDSWTQRFAVVSQDNFLLNDTIKNNIALGKMNATDEEIERAARVAHAHSFIEQLQDGYDTVIGDRGYTLSGGQVQRLTLARAIVRDADILVLDEATSALDSISEQEIMRAIEELHGSKTFVLVAHRLSTVRKAERIYVLDEGRIVEQGSHAELIGAAGTYAQLWNQQASSPIH